MSFDAMAWAWKQQGLSATQKLVLMGLANYADRDNLTSFPSVKALATDCGVGSRTVERACAELELTGLIERLAQYRRDGSRTSNLYKLYVRMADTPATESGGPATESGLHTVIEPVISTPLIDIPPPLETFHTILLEAPGYTPKPQTLVILAALCENGRIDAEEEALKILGWLNEPKQKREHRTASDAQLLNWFRRIENDARATAANPRATRAQPGNFSEPF